MELNQRSQFILKTLIQRFIIDGQPLASKALVEYTGLDLSSATIRNIMAKLEDIGLVTSKHSSSGKMPTSKGYRFFVNSLLVNNPQIDNTVFENTIKETLIEQNLSPKQAIAYASKTISSLTECASVVFTPYNEDILQKVELVQIDNNKILMIFISQQGEIQNHIFTTKKEYTINQITEAVQFINTYCKGLTISSIHSRLTKDINKLQQHILELTQATLNINKQLNSENLLITGEHKLIQGDLSKNMQELKKLFALFDEKQELLNFLQEFSNAQGIQIFIGGESEVLPIKDMSILTMSFINNNHLIGSLGIIGPMRMEYNKVISMLDITAKLMNNHYQE